MIFSLLFITAVTGPWGEGPGEWQVCQMSTESLPEHWGPGSEAAEMRGVDKGDRGVPSLSCPPSLPLSQRCLDWNRDILKKELGLTEQDIIDLPALFKMDEDRQARAYFPNMVRCHGPRTSSRPIGGSQIQKDPRAEAVFSGGLGPSPG